MAVLIKHHNLGYMVLNLVENGPVDSGKKQGLPRAIAEVCRVVCQARRALIKVFHSLIHIIV